MRGNAAEERMGRGARRVGKGLLSLISGKKSKLKSTSRPRRKSKRKPAFSQDDFKASLRKNRRSF